MEHVDRPADVEPLPEPLGEARARMELEPLRDVLRSERARRIGGHRRWRGHVGQTLAVRAPDREGPVGESLDLVALLVHRPVMPAAQEREVRQRGRAPLRPVAHVMPFADPDVAAREAAALVPMEQRPP